MDTGEKRPPTRDEKIVDPQEFTCPTDERSEAVNRPQECKNQSTLDTEDMTGLIKPSILGFKKKDFFNPG